MRKLLFVALMSLIILISSGCAKFGLNKTEIDKIFNTRIIGIDAEDNGKVLLTLVTKSANSSPGGSGGGGGGGAETSEILVSEGDSVFDAARRLLTHANKKPHYGHTEYILIGEETARKGILPYLDFISRNYEFRYNAKIYIVKGDTAYNLINQLNVGDMFLSDKLSTMEDNAGNLSESSKETLAEAMFIFDKPKISTYLPCIEIVPSIFTNDTHSTSHGFSLKLKGYAIFKEDKLQDFITGDLSRAINWVRKKIQSGIIMLKTPTGKIVSMEIISSKTVIKPHIEKNGLSCDIKVSFTTNVAEVMAKEDIFKEDIYENLEKQQDRQIKKEIEDIIALAQSRNLDIFGTVSNFIMAYPGMKNELKDNWGDLFPNVKFDVTVDSNINRAYLLREPTGSKK